MFKRFPEPANNYKQFIKDFMAIAKLLHNLMKKEQKWN